MGFPGAPRHPHPVTTTAGDVWEFPPSVMRVLGLNLPVSGGGYFRLFPAWWSHFCLRRINRVSGQPFMFYVHPWEIDPDQPRMQAACRMSRFRHYVNLSQNESKLDRLLSKFRFGRVSDVLKDVRTLAPAAAASRERLKSKPELPPHGLKQPSPRLKPTPTD